MTLDRQNLRICGQSQHIAIAFHIKLKHTNRKGKQYVNKPDSEAVIATSRRRLLVLNKSILMKFTGLTYQLIDGILQYDGDGHQLILDSGKK